MPRRALKMAKATNGPTTAMEKILAPRVVRPPWARMMAWKRRTIVPRMVMAVGPKRMAPRATPVGWEQEPVTEGILRAERTKEKAPDMPRVSLVWGLRATCLEMERIPRTMKGAERANQT